jgi:hypothetical protein
MFKPTRIKSDLGSVFGVDLRSLGAFRIVLGALILTDLALRARFLEYYLSDAGPFPRHAIPYVPILRSLFFLSGDVAMQAVLYGGLVIVTLMFTIGYKTRSATVATWFLFASLHSRCPMVLDGQDYLPLQFLIWSMFLPMGACYSIDAMRRKSLESDSPCLSPASAAILLQLIAMYTVTGLAKSGSSWADGTALWRSLGSDDWVMPLGAWLRQDYSLTKVLSRVVLWFELLAPLAFLVPFKQNLIRAVAIPAFLFFQIGIALSINLRLFPWMSTAGLLLFIPGAWWDRLGSRSRPREADEAELPAEPRGGSRRSVVIARELVVVSLMILAVIQALDCIARNRSISHLASSSVPNALARQIGATQNWNMYAPDPGSHEFRIKVAGIQEGRRVIDMLDTPGATAWKKAKGFHRTYRFQYYLEQLFVRRDSHPELLDVYLHWICSEWHASANPEDRIDAARFFAEVRDLRPVERQPSNMVFVSQYLCFPDTESTSTLNAK